MGYVLDVSIYLYFDLYLSLLDDGNNLCLYLFML
jgi:hypothetical protein